MEPAAKKSLKCPNCGANVAGDSPRCDYCRAVLTITACPACFGAVFKGMKHCPDCGAAIERSEVISSNQLKCPRCEQILAPADIAATRIHECSSCGGFWLDDATFQQICADQEQQEKIMIYPSPARSAELNPAIRARRFYIPCPVCGELMNQRNFAGCSGVVIDVCKPHGIWFDRQEMQRIVNFIKEGGLKKARENELINLKAEQNRLREMQYENSHEPVSLQENAFLPDPADGTSLIGIIYSICKKIF